MYIPRGKGEGAVVAATRRTCNSFEESFFSLFVCVASVVVGQLIRIYGHIPFVPGPVPPPLQPGEQFWQQLFQHQYQVHAPTHAQQLPYQSCDLSCDPVQLFSQTPGLLRLFQQHEQVHNPSPLGQATDPTAVSCDQATPIQQQVPPIKHPPATEHTSIWSVGGETLY